MELTSVASTTPNKEIVRRICILSGGSICYIRVDTGDEYVDVLTDIEESNLNNCLQELESWAGMKFRIYTLKNKTPTTKKTTAPAMVEPSAKRRLKKLGL